MCIGRQVKSCAANIWIDSTYQSTYSNTMRLDVFSKMLTPRGCSALILPLDGAEGSTQCAKKKKQLYLSCYCVDGEITPSLLLTSYEVQTEVCRSRQRQNKMVMITRAWAAICLSYSTRKQRIKRGHTNSALSDAMMYYR